MLRGIASAMNTEGRRQPLTVKSYRLIEPPYCIYKIKQNLRNPADDLTPACPIVGRICGADFDTKFHQEQKPCFHNNGCLATLL